MVRDPNLLTFNYVCMHEENVCVFRSTELHFPKDSIAITCFLFFFCKCKALIEKCSVNKVFFFFYQFNFIMLV